MRQQDINAYRAIIKLGGADDVTDEEIISLIENGYLVEKAAFDRWWKTREPLKPLDDKTAAQCVLLQYDASDHYAQARIYHLYVSIRADEVVDEQQHAAAISRAERVLRGVEVP